MEIDQQKARVIGGVSGLIGSLLGVIPIGILREYLQHLFFSGRGVNIGGPYDLFDLFSFLLTGIPLPFMGIFIVPICGVLFGILGVNTYRKRQNKSGSLTEKLFKRRLWLIGGISGFLFNFLVSFWAQ